MLKFRIKAGLFLDILHTMALNDDKDTFVRVWKDNLAFTGKMNFTLTGVTLKKESLSVFEYDDDEFLELLPTEMMINKLSKVPKAEVLEVIIDDKCKYSSLGGVKYKGEFPLIGLPPELPTDKSYDGLSIDFPLQFITKGAEIANYIKYLDPSSGEDITISTEEDNIKYTLFNDNKVQNSGIEVNKSEVNILKYEENIKAHYQGKLLLPIINQLSKYDLKVELGSDMPLNLVYENDEIKIWGLVAPDYRTD